jgi:hypothetical protein
MKSTAIFLLLVSLTSLAASQEQKRDAALAQIHKCRERNEVSSRACRKLAESIADLEDVYRSGDKTVLRTLFTFPYLTEFYGDALLSDPERFVAEMNLVSEQDRNAVADGLAGGPFGLASRSRFESIRESLRRIEYSSALGSTAATCLKAVERQNASFFVAYFPAQTFANRAGEFESDWFSREMYALGEKPLWPDSRSDETIYRLTYVPPFSGPAVITLTLHPDTEPEVAIRRLGADRATVILDETSTAPLNHVSDFLAEVNGARFWASSTDLAPPARRRQTDGAKWILEGMHEGKYHVVVRWCPMLERQSAEEIRFGQAGLLLFEVAGHKHLGDC